MKIQADRRELLDALTAACKAVPGRTTIPILNNALLRADGETLTCAGTDLSIAITASLAATGEPGETTVGANLLRGVIRAAADGPVTLESGDDALSVTCSGRHYALNTIPAEDFPQPDISEFNHEFETDLGGLCAPVKYAMSHEETRPDLCGVFLHEHEGGLRAIATNGHELAYRDCDLPGGAEGMPGIIIPSDMIGKLQAGRSTVQLSDRAIRVVNEAATITSKLIDGTFPDYARLLPDHTVKAIVERETAIGAAQALSLVANDQARCIKLSFSGGKLEMEARGDARDKGVETLDCDYSGDDIAFGLNARYLVDTLSAFDCERICIGMTNPGSPPSFTDPDDTNRYALIMPMRAGF